MTIGKRLQYGFGVMVILFAVIFAVNFTAMMAARSAQNKTDNKDGKQSDDDRPTLKKRD